MDFFKNRLYLNFFVFVLIFSGALGIVSQFSTIRFPILGLIYSSPALFLIFKYYTCVGNTMVSYRVKHALSIVADFLAFSGAILVVVSIFGTNVDQLEKVDDHAKVEQLIKSIKDNQKYTIAGLVCICIAAFLRAFLLHIFEFIDMKNKTKT